MSWRPILVELLEQGAFSTQEDVVRALESAGHEVSQGTVSRELRRIGAVKIGGAYRLAPALELGAPVHEVHVTAGGCLVVIKTDPAFASVVGSALDAAAPPGVLGCLSGDDTVFVALTGMDAANDLRRLIGVPAPR